MSLRRRRSALPLRVVCLFALALATGCAKRYEGSLKDDAASARETKPARAQYAAPRHKAPRPTPVAQMPTAPQADVPKSTREPCASSERCAAELRAMLNDQSRSWVGKPQTVEEHLTGTRQFAYLALLKVMTCPELSSAQKDIQSGILKRAPAGIYPAPTLEKIKDLDAHVVEELKKERAARCPR